MEKKGRGTLDEKYYDAMLNVLTREDRVINPFFQYYPYEPTPYAVLKQLSDTYPLTPEDRLVDFGCGKGRTLFYLNYMFGCNVCGIEMNEKLYKDAENNRKRYIKRHPHAAEKIEILPILAEKYEVDQKDNKFYFFHPFSVTVFKKVITNIMRSLELHPRQADIIVYYPTEEYLCYLDHKTDFRLNSGMLIHGAYEKNKQEQILIYRYDG